MPLLRRTWLPTPELYAIFLAQDFWKALSQAKKLSVGCRCERCESRKYLHSHHLRYRPNWFDTALEDLQVLCLGCHREEHGMRRHAWTPRMKFNLSSHTPKPPPAGRAYVWPAEMRDAAMRMCAPVP